MKEKNFFVRQGQNLFLIGVSITGFLIKGTNESNTEFFALLPEKKTEGLFTPVSVDEVAFPKGAAEQKLDRIYAACIIFCYTDRNRSDPSHFFYAARGRGGTSRP